MRLPDTFRSSSFRLTLAHALIFAFSVSVLFAVVYHSTVNSLNKQFDHEINAELSTLVGEASAEGRQGVSEMINRRIDPRGPTEDFFLLQDPSGARIAGNLDVMDAKGGWRDIQARYDPITQRRHKEHVIRARGAVLDDGSFVVVGRDTHPIRQLREIVVRGFAICLGATIALAIGIGWLMSANVLRRVRVFINLATRAIMRGDLARRITAAGGGGEFDELVGHINAMLDRIEKLIDDMRQVTNDIAHDLRTPLTRLRQGLELARLSARSPDEYGLAIDKAIADANGILETFTAMLRIAQIESGSAKAGFGEVDLSTLLDGIVETYGPVAEDCRHRLTGRVASGVKVVGDGRLLTQLFANLVENALRHTPEGTAVELTLDAARPRITAAVADNGPGIPDAMLKSVFQRFFRLEASRTTEGSGLGLSLVEAIAELHGIGLELCDNMPGLKISLAFPAR